jgi:hypothetical protein
MILKKKLNIFADELLQLTIPSLFNRKAQQIADDCMSKIYNIAKSLREDAKSL